MRWTVVGLSVAMVAMGWGAQASAPKVSGVFFGDFYRVLGHHDREADGKGGTWLRRINLTYDATLGEGLSARFRLEAKDPGDFRTESALEPYVKDLWVRWQKGGHTVLVGLLPTPTTEPAEAELGYRPIERHTLDLLRMGSTRDKGLGLQGPLDSRGRWRYQLVVGDASGTKSSTGDTFAAYGRVEWRVSPNLLLDLYGDWWDRKGGSEWTTWKLEAVGSGAFGKLGLMVATQRRREPGHPGRMLNVGSVFAEWDASASLRPFVWLHFSEDPIPGAEQFDFYRMSAEGKPAVWLLGVRCRLSDAVELIPTLVRVEYRRAGDAPRPGADTMIRLTWSGRF